MKEMPKILIFFFIVLFMLSGSAAAQTSETKEDPEMDGNIQIETAVTDSFAMDYFRFGHGKNILVILPGLSVQSVMPSAGAVAEAYQILTDDFTVYLFDRRKDLQETYSVNEMARDTAAAFRAAGLDQVNLFGASQGGMIAMEIAIQNPELVKKLVLGSTSSCVTDEQYQMIGRWIRMAKEGSAEELYLAFGEAIYPQAVFEQAKGLLTDAAKTVTDEDLDRFMILAEGMKGFDATADLDKISCPVLLLGSNDDQVLGADAAMLIAEHLGSHPDFEVYMYDGYGHAAYDTAPDYKERIMNFLLHGQQ